MRQVPESATAPATAPVDPRSRVLSAVLAHPVGPPVGGGRDELLYRVAMGAWTARHSGLLALTPDQSLTFFTWLGATFDVALPERPSVLTGVGHPLDVHDSSLLRVTLGEIEDHGLEQLDLERLARAAWTSPETLVSTFGGLRPLLEAQHQHLLERIHDADAEVSRPSSATVLVDELARFFDADAADARLALLTLTGMTRRDARSMLDLELHHAVLDAPALDPAALAALLLLDAHRLPGPWPDSHVPLPRDLRALAARRLTTPGDS